jgi:hypothetical protein
MRADQSPEQQPEEVQQVATRRSKRNIGSKTVRCLASAKSTPSTGGESARGGCVEDAKVPVGGEN